MAENLEQPKMDVQQMLDELLEAEPEVVSINGRKTRIGWLHKDTERRMSHVMLRGEDLEKKAVKWYALARLDMKSGFLTWFFGWFLYEIYWRWLWYVKREQGTEFQMGVLAATKKKIQQRSDAFALSSVLMIGAMDTMMMKARHEHGPVAPSGVEITP
jgi:hypothetical protein